MSLSTRTVGILLVALAACSDSGTGDAGARSTPCPEPTAVPEREGLPEDLQLERYGTITRVERSGQAVGVEIVSEDAVVELYPPLARGLLDAGYQITSGENEGFEAEIFFARRDVAGAYRLREGPCEGQVTIKVLYGIDRGRA